MASVLPDDDQPAGTASRDAYSEANDALGADVARRQLRSRGIVPIEPDELIRCRLAPGERVVAVRRGVALERRKGWVRPDSRLHGDLYVTTLRLVHLGRIPVEYLLDDIQEVAVAAGVLLLVVGDGHGVEIEVGDPRVLRVEIAGVREVARASARAKAAGAAPTQDLREAGDGPGPGGVAGGSGGGYPSR